MFYSGADTKAMRASLRRICWKHILDTNSLCLRFVFNHLPQLIERPAMQTRAHFFASSNSFPNILQVLHYYRTATILFCLVNNLFGNTVINVFNVTSFSARDLSQCLSSRLRTFALKTFSCSQKLISLSSKKTSSKQFSRRSCSQNIFSQIDPHDVSCFNKQNIGEIEHEVKKPLFSPANQFCFFWKPEFKKRLVKLANLKRNLNPSLRSKERQDTFFQRICSFVKMDRACLFKDKLFRILLRFQPSRDFSDSIATHLRTQFGKLLPQRSVRQMVQPNTVPFPVQKSHRGYMITRFCKQILKLTKKFILKARYAKFKGNCSFHRKEFKMPGDLKTIFREQRFLPALKGQVSALSKG